MNRKHALTHLFSLRSFVWLLAGALGGALLTPAPAQVTDAEWDPTWGYHEEEWYDPSDWFDDDYTVEYEDQYWEDDWGAFDYEYGANYDYDFDEDWNDYDYADYGWDYNYYTDDWYDDEDWNYGYHYDELENDWEYGAHYQSDYYGAYDRDAGYDVDYEDYDLF